MRKLRNRDENGENDGNRENNGILERKKEKEKEGFGTKHNHP